MLASYCGNARDHRTDSELARGVHPANYAYTLPLYWHLRHIGPPEGVWTRLWYRSEHDRAAGHDVFRPFGETRDTPPAGWEEPR